MAFCPKCGVQVDEQTKFCPACGASMETGAGAAQENFQQAFVTEDSTNQFDPADIQKNKGLSVLSYLGILFLVPLLAAKDSKFARFHVNQGLVLFIFEVAWNILAAVLPIRGPLLFINAAVGILELVLIIMGIVNAAKGQAKNLPVIGTIRILKD